MSDAAIGVFAVRTREPFRALKELATFSLDNEIPYKIWTILNGWQEFRGPDGQARTVPNDFTSPASTDETIMLNQALGKIKDSFSEGCFIVFGGHYALEDPSVQQHIKNLTQHVLDNTKRVVFVFPEGTVIPPAIEDDIHILDFKAPSFAELHQTWDLEINNVEPEFALNFDEDQIGLVLRNALGMSQQEFSNAIGIALVKLGNKLKDHTVEAMDFVRIILDDKVEIIKRTDILELLPEANMNEIGGLDNLKEWLDERAPAMTDDDARAFGIDPPKGVLLVGPPGGGKSQIAKATATTLGVTGIKFDVGRVFGKYVGESEQRTRRALALIDAMAPVFVLVDEVDKGLGGIGGGGGDSGTSQRVLGTILTWMQDRTLTGAPPVFLMFTANNVVGLPPELMRKGRLDEIFAVTFPGEVERLEILKIHLNKRGHQVSDDQLRKVAQATNQFVGAELEAIVKEALIKAFSAKRHGKTIDLTEAMLKVAGETTPLSKAFADAINVMNGWAKNNAKPASRDMRFDPVVVEGSVPSGVKQRLLRRPPGGVIRPRNTQN